MPYQPGLGSDPLLRSTISRESGIIDMSWCAHPIKPLRQQTADRLMVIASNSLVKRFIFPPCPRLLVKQSQQPWQQLGYDLEDRGYHQLLGVSD